MGEALSFSASQFNNIGKTIPLVLRPPSDNSHCFQSLGYNLTVRTSFCLKMMVGQLNVGFTVRHWLGKWLCSIHYCRVCWVSTHRHLSGFSYNHLIDYTFIASQFPIRRSLMFLQLQILHFLMAPMAFLASVLIRCPLSTLWSITRAHRQGVASCTICLQITRKNQISLRSRCRDRLIPMIPSRGLSPLVCDIYESYIGCMLY